MMSIHFSFFTSIRSTHIIHDPVIHLQRLFFQQNFMSFSKASPLSAGRSPDGLPSLADLAQIGGRKPAKMAFMSRITLNMMNTRSWMNVVGHYLPHTTAVGLASEQEGEL